MSTTAANITDGMIDTDEASPVIDCHKKVDDFKITQEMIDAGATAVEWYQDGASDDSYVPLNAPALARAVYTAMRPLEPCRSPRADKASASVPATLER